MSVITHRPFASVIRNAGYGNAEKLTDLLGRLSLNDRIIGSLKELPQLLKKDIDYKAVDEVVRNERKKSYAYLERQIKNECENN